MGAALDWKSKMNMLKRSSAGNYVAEIFFDELQFILNENLINRVMIICHGMNTRVKSKDLLSVSLRYLSTPSSYKEIVTLHLARNSMYHQLPEMLFYPLVISTPGMSNKEIVDAIRTNKSKEKELVAFFSPFDTEFFKEHIRINNRHLNFFSDPASRKILDSIIERLQNVDLPISVHEKFKLFLFLCNAEKYKENLPEIERMFFVVFGLNIKLRYIPHMIVDSLYQPTGEGILGLTLGLNGPVQAEEDDLKATIIFERFIDDYSYLKDVMTNVSTVLGFFILSVRKIHVEYIIEGEVDCILGQNRLGYNMNL